ncbi:histone arginine methyltransferase PRMT5 [Besnoitia besnoiti]|uniref:Histone arginine methyltransferase PRMT5 n=1 Tax=Besnoitia besnoiti TaxID=94643 RepID=A0A2A9MIF3_BESBE|nr:histone arginine methyltransferase PRMT5 [Besnoitia besnoiti]PFH36984.1 histone arginine methyltransferase PRMT5 [Besnoitia besnoiti]
MPLHSPSDSCLTAPVYFGVGLSHSAVRTPASLRSHLQTVRSNLQCDFVVIPTAAASSDLSLADALRAQRTSSSSSAFAPLSSPPSAAARAPVRASIPLDHLPVFAVDPAKKADAGGRQPSALASFATCSFRGVDGGLTELPESYAFTPSTGSDLALDSHTWSSSVVCELSPWIAPDRHLCASALSLVSSSSSSSATSAPTPGPSGAAEREDASAAAPAAAADDALCVAFDVAAESEGAAAALKAPRPPRQFAHWSFHAAAWKREMQWAAHVGAYAIIAPVPHAGDVPIEYARQLRAVLSQLQPPSVWLRLPLVYPRETRGAAAASAPPPATPGSNLPSEEDLARWLAEPIRAVLVSPAIFTCAADPASPAASPAEAEGGKRGAKSGGRGLSVALSPRHFSFLARCAEHRVKIILRQDDEEEAPGEGASAASVAAAAAPALDPTDDAAFPALRAAASPARREAKSAALQAQAPSPLMDMQPYLSYIVARFLQLPSLPPAALFAAPYRDVLQSPMQPLADNLSTMNYEVFERDPVKYVRYRQATLRRLREIWGPAAGAVGAEKGSAASPEKPAGKAKGGKKKKKASSHRRDVETDSDFGGDSWDEEEEAEEGERRGAPTSPSAATYKWCLGGLQCREHSHIPEVFPGGRQGRLVIMVVGAGRGPLVQAALDALREAEVPLCRVHLYAVEKNCNAVITLRSRQQHDRCEGWRAVRVVESDMREVGREVTEKADILISELLGSFGDNELSVECLHGAQRKLLKRGGVSIPTAYVSSLEPVSSPRLWTAIDSYGDAKHFESPYVVDLFAVYRPGREGPLECFHFRHPEPLLPFAGEKETDPPGDATAAAGATAGTAAGPATQGAGARRAWPAAAQLTAWRHRRTRLAWEMKADAVVHGLAGYFHCCLYADVHISIDPRSFSEGMFSWFPLFLPFRVPVYVRRGEALEVYVAREGDEHRVWYEWAVIQPTPSDIYNHLGTHSFIGK